MNFKHMLSALAAAAMLGTAATAGAATVVSLFGDKDGLGIGLVNGQGFDYEAIGPADGNGTDEWLDGDFSFQHTYTLSGTVTSASLEIFSGAWGLGGAASVFLNGTLVGTLTIGDAVGTLDPDTVVDLLDNHAFKDVFDLAPHLSLLTGHDSIGIRLVDPVYDSGALDYSQLSVTTLPVPEPATSALFGLGLAGLVAFARRRDTAR